MTNLPELPNALTYDQAVFDVNLEPSSGEEGDEENTNPPSKTITRKRNGGKRYTALINITNREALMTTIVKNSVKILITSTILTFIGVSSYVALTMAGTPNEKKEHHRPQVELELTETPIIMVQPVPQARPPRRRY